MTQVDPIIFRELRMIQKIIADETWLEGERRGAAVSPDDPVVKENVCNIIVRIGEKMRELMRVEIETEAAALSESKRSRAA